MHTYVLIYAPYLKWWFPWSLHKKKWLLSDHANGLHQGIADGGAHETKSWQKAVRRLQINRNVCVYIYIYIYYIFTYMEIYGYATCMYNV